MRRVVLLALLPLLAACSRDDGAPATAGTDAGGCQETPGIAYRTDARLQFLHVGPGGATEPLKTIGIEIADTDSTMMRGLMDRRCLPPDWGMLFVFPDAQPRTFYMANTPRSLDIMFVAGDSTILNVAKYTEPFSPAIVPSEGSARFVVETPAGFTDRYGVVTGDRVAWGTSLAPADSASAGSATDTLAAR